MSTIKVDTIKNTSNVEVFTAKAWVNFDATTSMVIGASGNVDTIIDNGAGDYTINFTTAMPDSQYALVMNVRRTAARVFWTSTLSASSARVIAANLSQTPVDETMSVVFFR